MKEIADILNPAKYLAKPSSKHDVQQLVDFYLKCRGWANKPKQFYVKAKVSYSRLCREAKDVLKVSALEEAMQSIDTLNYKAQKQGFSWTLRTVIKKDLKVKL